MFPDLPGWPAVVSAIGYVALVVPLFGSIGLFVLDGLLDRDRRAAKSQPGGVASGPRDAREQPWNPRQV